MCREFEQRALDKLVAMAYEKYVVISHNSYDFYFTFYHIMFSIYFSFDVIRLQVQYILDVGCNLQ